MSRQHAVGDIAREFAGEPWGYPIRRAVELAEDAVRALQEAGYKIIEPKQARGHALTFHAYFEPDGEDGDASCTCGESVVLVRRATAERWFEAHMREQAGQL